MLGASRASNRTKVIYIAEANEDVEAGAATTPKLFLTHEEAPGTTHDAAGSVVAGSVTQRNAVNAENAAGGEGGGGAKLQL